MGNFKVVFFDLFFTLITPYCHLGKNENDVLGISVSEWEKYAENEMLYHNRAIGNVLNPIQIVDEIAELIPFYVDEVQKLEILQLRESRMKNALQNVDEKILLSISNLKETGMGSYIKGYK